jgi:V/A-type H+-transporting ATPase subunit E
MDVQLSELIDRIKREGVETAEEQSKQIVADAEKRAQQILEDARKEGDQIIQDAKKEASKLEQSGKQAVAQAGRDLILKLQNQITDMFDRVAKDAVAETMSGDVLENIITKIAESWDPQSTDGLEVSLSEGDRAEVAKALEAKLGERFKEGVEFKASPGVKAGFRVGEKDGSAYYDFTAEGVAESLGVFLNPRLADILKEAAKNS